LRECWRSRSVDVPASSAFGSRSVQPWHLVRGVIGEGAVMAAGGVVVGAALGFALATVAGSYFPEVRLPDAVPVTGAAVVLLIAAVGASVLPAARAARVDVTQALRSD